jgi:hypothetical protein
MSSPSPRRLVAILGLIVSALFVFAAVRHLDTRAVIDVWRTAKPLPWLPVGAACYVAGHFVRGARLRFLVRRDARLSIPTASNVIVVGYASNNVLPARLGEIVRAGMLAERTGIPLAQSLTVTFIERLLDGVAILFLLVLATLQSEAAGWIRQLARVSSAVFGIALVSLAILIVVPRAVLSIAARVFSLFGTRWHDRLLGMLTGIIGATSCLRRPLDAVVIVSLSGLVWFVESMMFMSLMPSVSLPVSAQSGIIAMSVTNLGILLPSTPGFVGPFHFFCSQALVAQGAPAPVALAYAVLVHLTFWIPATLWGAGAMFWYGVQVGASVALARAAKKSPHNTIIHGVTAHVIARVPRAPRHQEPTKLDIALTESMLPEGFTIESARDVAAFLAGQIEALPPRLRALYHAGMTAFRMYVRLRHGRSFCGLSLAERRRVVAAWAFGRLGLLRQLFRPVRSTVLLAYYERPDAAVALETIDVAPEAVVRPRKAHG